MFCNIYAAGKVQNIYKTMLLIIYLLSHLLRATIYSMEQIEHTKGEGNHAIFAL